MVYTVVFFGGPGTGKSTQLGRFSKREYVGYLANIPVVTVPETAREIVHDEQLQCGVALPWVDLKAFQKKVFSRQLEKEARFKEYPGVILLDRGMDGVGYCRLGWLSSDPEAFPEREAFSQAVKKESKVDIVSRLEMEGYGEFIPATLERRYDLVFEFEPLCNYCTDDTRKEDRELASRIGEVVLDTYKKFGYNPLSVPEFSRDKDQNIQMRFDFILDEINKRIEG